MLKEFGTLFCRQCGALKDFLISGITSSSCALERQCWLECEGQKCRGKKMLKVKRTEVRPVKNIDLCNMGPRGQRR